MKRILCAGLLIALLILPGLGLTEGDDTISLARTLYTLGRDEDDATLLMLGSVIMNRVDSPWFPDSVEEVLGEPHQFPHGMLYDERCLQVARALMMGRRTLDEDVVYFVHEENEAYFSQTSVREYAVSGSYIFYEMIWDDRGCH